MTLARHRGLPSGSITLAISFAEPIRLVGGPGAEGGPRRLGSLVGGLHLGPAVIEQDRCQHGLHVELNPLGIRALLGVTAAELTSDVIGPAELPVRWGRGLAERLAELPGWENRFALLDREFRASLRPVTMVGEIQ